MLHQPKGRTSTATVVVVSALTIQMVASSAGGPLPVPLFPADNWWNVTVATAPVDPASPEYLRFIDNGSIQRLHPDFGGERSTGSVGLSGFPYVVVDAAQPKQIVQFQNGAESDGVNHETGVSYAFYPIPDEAATQPQWIEGGEPGNVDRRSTDRRLIIVDRERHHLYELFNVYYDGGQWHAGSGAFFDLNTNARRPEGWRSADVAGLAILPGLVRYDEVYGPDEIRHAFRVRLRTTNGHVFPASHQAASTAGALPLGARLRLKADVDLAQYPPEVQKIFRAMKQYGLIVADHGSDMFVSGTFDRRWNATVLNPAFESLTTDDFEVVQLGWKPTSSGLPGAPQNLRLRGNF